MKILIALIFLVLPITAMASSGDLYFSEGPMKGQNVLESSVGTYQMCFTGNAYAVRHKVLKLMKADIEKDQPAIRFDRISDSLIISYVDTKCLDDSLDATPDSCRAVWTASRCN